MRDAFVSNIVGIRQVELSSLPSCKRPKWALDHVVIKVYQNETVGKARGNKGTQMRWHLLKYKLCFVFPECPYFGGKEKVKSFWMLRLSG